MPRGSRVRALLLCPPLLLIPTDGARADMLCARDEVAQTVAREMQRRNHYAVLDRGSVLEWSTDDPNTVRCTALALVEAPYAPAGERIHSYKELYRFIVTVTGHRFTVRFLD